jgi:hypothetical protein
MKREVAWPTEQVPRIGYQTRPTFRFQRKVAWPGGPIPGMFQSSGSAFIHTGRQCGNLGIGEPMQLARLAKR